MAQISLEEVYCGDKYDVLSAVGADLLRHGCPKDYDTQTWLEMTIVRATCCPCILLVAAEKMKKEGDFVSDITDIEPLSYYAERCKNENT